MSSDKQKITFEPKVLVFACNWCSYAGADNAGVSRIPYSSNVRLLRTMCSGRVHPSFVLKAFAEGADGVIISGCHFGDCHYIFGNYKAEEQYTKLQQIVNLLGLEKERIALEWISAAEGPRFAEVINIFVNNIRELGPSPLRNGGIEKYELKNGIDLQEYKLYECLECGRCSGVCPVAKTHRFSPRRLLSKGISQGINSIGSDSTIWACLTCKLCENVCPADIPYSEMNKQIRSVSYQKGIENTCTHGGVFEEVSKLMTKKGIKQNRLGWITDDIRTSDNNCDTIFFIGCSPYFAGYFEGDCKDKLIGALRSSLKLLNKVGIEPHILPNELCCGHDVLLRGEQKLFCSLAANNYEQIINTKAKRIIFSCPECFVTIRDEYPKIVGNMNLEIFHISEILYDEKRKLKFNETHMITTYQDPCRLGRYSGIYNKPREMINSIPGVELREMEHNQEYSICCGNTAWIGCDAGTKELQKNRIKEVYKAECKNLLTACPKCYIHLTCALNGQNGESNNSIKIHDIWNLIDSHLQ